MVSRYPRHRCHGRSPVVGDAHGRRLRGAGHRVGRADGGTSCPGPPVSRSGISVKSYSSPAR
ncbi:hypothetical protein AC792_09725 [Arthrobacter sp. RIT-PI-e]|nr:hypothetical protein AC792_09725 [Arthrobacter sp. RIT-PI-e]